LQQSRWFPAKIRITIPWKIFRKWKKLILITIFIPNNENSVEQAQKDNFRLLNINTFSGGCERVVEAHQWLKIIEAGIS
jgi:hypothetical protein